MKNFLTISVFVFAVFGFVACQKAAAPVPDDEPNEPVSVKIGLDNVDNLGDSDLIAVQIYKYNGEVRDVYAYGLFDNYSFGELELMSGVEYSASATMVRDGQNIIAKEESGDSPCYYKPFSHYATKPLAVTNSFVVSRNFFLYMSQGVASIPTEKSYKNYKHPLLERFVGHSEKFEAAENFTINIPLKRVYGAFKLQAKGLTEGKLVFSFDDSQKIILSSEQSERTINMSLKGSLYDEAAWLEDNYNEQVEYSVEYISEDGEVIKMGDEMQIDLVRGKIQPITINVRLTSTLSLTIEQGTMDELPEIVLPDFVI